MKEITQKEMDRHMREHHTDLYSHPKSEEIGIPFTKNEIIKNGELENPDFELKPFMDTIQFPTPTKKEGEWEKLIQLNLNCGCSLGKCVKCAPIILIVSSLLHSKEKEIRESIAKEVKEKGLHLGYRNNILEIIRGDKEIK